MDWIVKVEDRKDWNIRHIIRTCPKCKDERVIKASQIYDWYCPNCGQKMERPKGD